MKQMLPSVLKTPFLLALSLSVGAMFWITSLPLALGASATAAQMIQANLPHSMTLSSAPKADLLSAICKAVSKQPNSAADIAQAAARARKELTSDILKTALKCVHAGDNCELGRSILREVIAVDADQASSLTEIFVESVPGCAGAGEGSEGGATSGGNLSAPGTLGGGGGGAAAGGNTCIACLNNQNVELNCEELSGFLKGHPGATAGSCQATPVTNR